MNTSRFQIGLCLSVVMLLTGCESKPPAGPKPAAGGAPVAAKQGAAETKELREFLRKDSDVPGDSATHIAPAKASGAKSAGKLRYTAPAQWKTEPVRSAMRHAQFTIPRAAGDTQDGQMIIFRFAPGLGGPTDANISRWKNMFSGRAGKPLADDAAKIEKREIAGLNVTTLDVSGMYQDPMMVQSGGAKVEGEARLLAAIVETPEGAYFLKAVGPRRTITAHETAFKKMLDSVKME